jgi:hypothetical protein
MDLSASPDIDARICYLVVFACGLISARIQIYKRITENKITGIWLAPSTWLVFGIYLFLPILLFWLMDRLNAIHDTSLFAALLIAFAYPAILAGGFGGLKPPEGVAGVLKPIEAFTDTVVKSVNARTARDARRFDQFIIGKMRSDEGLFNYLKTLALTQALGGAEIDQKLKEIDEKAAKSGADQLLVRDQKARLVYLHLTSIPDYVAMLCKDRRVVSRGEFWKAPTVRAQVIIWSVVVGMLVLLGAVTAVVTRPSQRITYHAWRLSKSNNTEIDRFRAREALRDWLQNSNTCAEARHKLARTLRAPTLAVERADMVIQLLLQNRQQTNCSPSLPELLVSALRVDNVDKRSRVHHALVMLASEWNTNFVTSSRELAEWKPSKGDAVTKLEDWIRDWSRVWQTSSATNAP